MLFCFRALITLYLNSILAEGEMVGLIINFGDVCWSPIRIAYLCTFNVLLKSVNGFQNPINLFVSWVCPVYSCQVNVDERRTLLTSFWIFYVFRRTIGVLCFFYTWFDWRLIHFARTILYGFMTTVPLKLTCLVYFICCQIGCSPLIYNFNIFIQQYHLIIVGVYQLCLLLSTLSSVSFLPRFYNSFYIFSC